MLQRSKTAQNGFTLIEVMIVVAIVAILATISYSSYRNNIVRSNRAAAVAYIMEVANLEERYLLDNRAYATGANALDDLGTTPPPEVSDNYNISITDPGGTAPDYQIEADPTGAQATDDACGKLTLDNQGARGHAVGGDRCWR